MFLSEYNEVPLEELHRHLEAEMGQNPFVAPTGLEFTSRQVALAAPLDVVALAAEGQTAIRSVVIDAAFSGGAVSLVATQGEVTLEFANGITRTGRGSRVEQSKRAFLTMAAESLSRLDLSNSDSFPASGRVKIWVRTNEALFIAEGGEKELNANDHALADLYKLGLQLMARILEEDE